MIKLTSGQLLLWIWLGFLSTKIIAEEGVLGNSPTPGNNLRNQNGETQEPVEVSPEFYQDSDEEEDNEDLDFDQDLCSRCQKVFAVDLHAFGFGPVVGAIGLFGVYHYKNFRTLEVAAGMGAFGNHLAVNHVHHLMQTSSLAWSYGFSYSSGDTHSRSKEKVGDAIWFNLGLSSRHQTANGFRYVFELGAGVAVASELMRNNEEGSKEATSIDPHFRIDEVDKGDVLINLTLVRMGYAF